MIPSSGFTCSQDLLDLAGQTKVDFFYQKIELALDNNQGVDNIIKLFKNDFSEDEICQMMDSLPLSEGKNLIAKVVSKQSKKEPPKRRRAIDTVDLNSPILR